MQCRPRCDSPASHEGLLTCQPSDFKHRCSCAISRRSQPILHFPLYPDFGHTHAWHVFQSAGVGFKLHSAMWEEPPVTTTLQGQPYALMLRLEILQYYTSNDTVKAHRKVIKYNVYCSVVSHVSQILPNGLLTCFRSHSFKNQDSWGTSR